MPKAKSQVGSYVVLNPRRIPEGRWIIHSGFTRDGEGHKIPALFYEGDVIDASQVTDAAGLIKRGFLRPVKEGSDG